MHSIRVSSQKMSFSAAHFVVGVDYCESLHGHNYTVEAIVTGPLDDNGMVLDFRDVKKQVVNVCGHLDHKVLLPENSKTITIVDTDISYDVNIGGKRYVFPKEDCMLLPFPATTAELIAEYIAGELQVQSDYSVKVCVSESLGSTGCYDAKVSQ
ncbi:MAG: 6-pyruvoyl tetrahydropterin synthase family protein [Candidatus Thorarchaeota archaeon]|nr:MAG: 6-pyruvoyl tetrahydropterin synthase family protein [Candidatus Thorarchaeota archaeon]